MTENLFFQRENKVIELCGYFSVFYIIDATTKNVKGIAGSNVEK